jgi:hypothetical protein
MPNTNNPANADKFQCARAKMNEVKPVAINLFPCPFSTLYINSREIISSKIGAMAAAVTM